MTINILLAALSITNALTLFYLFKLRSKIKKPREVKSQELTDFMRDLLRGGGCVTVRVNPEHLMIRSPRDA